MSLPIKIKSCLSLTLFSISLSYITEAQVSVTIFVNPAVGQFVTPTDSTLPDTSIFHFGTLNFTEFGNLSALAKKSPTEVFTLFNSYGSVSFSSGNIGVTGLEINTGVQGEQLFAFVADNSDLSSASFFGLFTSTETLWLYPGVQGGITLNPNSVDIALVGSIDDSSSVKKLFLEPVGISVIPEPAFFVFALPVFALAIGAMRRRR